MHAVPAPHFHCTSSPVNLIYLQERSSCWNVHPLRSVGQIVASFFWFQWKPDVVSCRATSRTAEGSRGPSIEPRGTRVFSFVSCSWSGPKNPLWHDADEAAMMVILDMA